MVVMLGRMPLDSYVMLNLLICCLCGEIRGLISQVPRPDFITQGVSPRRDVLYILDEVSDWSNQIRLFVEVPRRLCLVTCLSPSSTILGTSEIILILQNYSFQPEQKQIKRFFGKMLHKDEHPYHYPRASCFVEADWSKQDVTRYRN
jgi:hypothetical protein